MPPKISPPTARELEVLELIVWKVINTEWGRWWTRKKSNLQPTD